MKQYDVEVIEVHHVKRVYKVEAESAVEAHRKAEIGDTIEEEAHRDSNFKVYDRIASTPVPRGGEREAQEDLPAERLPNAPYRLQYTAPVYVTINEDGEVSDVRVDDGNVEFAGYIEDDAGDEAPSALYDRLLTIANGSLWPRWQIGD